MIFEASEIPQGQQKLLPASEGLKKKKFKKFQSGQEERRVIAQGEVLIVR